MKTFRLASNKNTNHSKVSLVRYQVGKDSKVPKDSLEQYYLQALFWECKSNNHSGEQLGNMY